MSAAFDKLRSKLSELFQLDAAAELDFGVYRILNARRVEVEAFLDSLQPQVDAILSQALQSGTTELKAELEKVEAGLRAGGIGEDMIASAPKVRELREKISTSGGDPTALTHDIFSHLTTFFSRYYKDGDFLSLRRYKRDTYAIPYEGEEVKLHWANADQYYIKSAENFRDYTFKLSSAADAPRVTFKLVEADTQKDNTKATAGQERRFIFNEFVSEAADKLVLGFHYRPVNGDAAEGASDSEEGDAAPEGKKKKKKKPDQKTLNAQAIQSILRAHAKGPFVELASLVPTKVNPNRTLLEKHLTDYTARNTFDYFIHKDLGGFLRRELDFYLKNEVLHLDDLDEAPETNWRETRARLKALRTLADKVIRFLSQIEDFQKKLWLKKKFVTACDYVVTLDRIPEALYPEIAACEAQRSEWVRLFAIDEINKGTEAIPATADLLDRPANHAEQRQCGYSEPLKPAFLRENPHLSVNTANFETKLRNRIYEHLRNETSLSGCVVKSDNFQALKSLGAKFAHEVALSYIDPPYNTGGDDFIYKDSYQHSSWLSAIVDRLKAAIPALRSDGKLAVSLDMVETPRFVTFAAQSFPGLQRFGEFVWRTRNTDNRVTSRLSVDHDFIHVFSNGGSPIAGRTIDRSDFKNPDKDKRGPYTTDPLTGKANAIDRPNLHYTMVNKETGDEYPPDPDFGWITDKKGYEELVANKLIYWPKNPKTGNPRKKRFLTEAAERAPVSSLGISIKQGEGNTDLSSLFGEKPMNFPKPVSVVSSVIDYCGDPQGTVLDFFAGSGTTGHAVINLNREDGGNRKYILIEMGEHFDTVLVPRLQKVIYSKDWKDGKPQSRNTGVSHCFKVLRLESYEDTLNNLRLHRSRAQELALESMTAEAREEYQLGYMLDLEATGSQSLLNVSAFEDPFAYTLNIATGTAGETKPVTVDLVETFNWLLGLTVLAQGSGGGVTWIEGTNPASEKVLVLWRKLKEVDADALNAWCKKQKISVLDGEFALIYINGDHHLDNLRRDDQTWKVRLIDEEFPKLMWEGCE